MYRELINRQKAFFRNGKTLSVSFRKRCLMDLRRAVIEMEPEINAALAEDLGKPATESYMCETGMTLAALSHAIRNIRKYTRKKRAATPLAQFPARSYIIPEPYGCVLVMSPWNYPFLLALSPAVSAIAAGNTVIIKPSEYSPATSAVVKKIVERIFQPEHVAVVEGDVKTSSELLEQRLDYIFFTGSTSVGKIVMGKAAEHLTPVTLELGGKSPVIVDRNVDIRTAARRIVFGKFLNCGQTCVAPDYVLVHEDIAGTFLSACQEEITAMYGQNPIDNPEYGRIINRRHFDRIISYISDVYNDPYMNISITFGGKADPERLKISPTIIHIGKITDKFWDRYLIMQQEIFGPVMPVLTYSDMEYVISYINTRPRPLAAYIFTEDRRVKQELLSRLHFGGGCVNDTIIHLATEQMPFGGVGPSGMGCYHGRYGFETFSHMKSIVDKPFRLDLPMRYQPYTKLKDRIIRMFLK